MAALPMQVRDRMSVQRVVTIHHCTAKKMLQKFPADPSEPPRSRCHERQQTEAQQGLPKPRKCRATTRVATYRHCTAGETLLNFKI